MMLLLLGGPLFGTLSDRFDRRRTVVVLLAAMAALSFAVSGALALGLFRWEFIYPYCLFVGLANVLDTTNRPAFVYDLLFARGSIALLPTAMAVRSLGANVGGVLAVGAVGLTVERKGAAGGFFVVATMVRFCQSAACNNK
jgi:nitrate/nitrite transporter NarK